VSDLRIVAVEKAFAGVRVLQGITLDIASGEFFTLLGPSGCGKTTLMRIAAGFLTQDAGEVHLGGERIDFKPAHTRDIGMVFQDYAVFPHLSVADNIAFGLRTRKVGKAEIDRRVAEIVDMVRLGGLTERLPSELSGGQQQRVGLARAMVIRPKLLLMDEPLSNLDAKLRLELRDDIRALQRKLGVTTIYVTHDQEEALAVSDRICVMNGGIAEQVGTPTEIYRRPARRFAAGFVGSMTFLTTGATGGALTLGGQTLRTSAADGAITCGIRPEHVRILAVGAAIPAGAITLDGRIARVTFLGPHVSCVASTDLGPIACLLSDADPGLIPAEGAGARIVLPVAHLHCFDASGTRCEVTP